MSLKELHIIILVGIIEKKKTPGRFRNSYIRQTKYDVRVKTIKGLNEKAHNRIKWRFKF